MPTNGITSYSEANEKATDKQKYLPTVHPIMKICKIYNGIKKLNNIFKMIRYSSMPKKLGVF